MRRGPSHAAWGALFAVGCIVGGAHIDPSLDDEGGGGGSRVGVPGDDDDAGGTGGVGVGGTSNGGAFPTGGVISVGGKASTGGSGQGGATTGGTSMTGGESGESSGGTGGDGGASSGSSGAAQGGSAGKGGNAGTAGGGKGGTAGIGGSPFGGSAGIGGSVGGTAGLGGSAGSVNIDPQCSGLKSNMPCVPEGKQCPNLSCGLGDVGRRDCICATNWTCISCNWTGTVLATKPANADTPCTGAGEGMICAIAPGSPESVCKSTEAPTEYCMCAINPRMPASPPVWDCDSPPSSW